jgi:hypothetical protein
MFASRLNKMQASGHLPVVTQQNQAGTDAISDFQSLRAALLDQSHRLAAMDQSASPK